MFVSTMGMFEKFHTAPYKKMTESSEDFLMLLETSCTFEKSDIERNIKNVSSQAPVTPLLRFGAYTTVSVFAVSFIAFMIADFNWVITAFLTLSLIIGVLLGFKYDDAKIAYGKRLRKESWVSFYETHFKQLHSSYFEPLYKNSEEFREMSKHVLNETELETTLVLVETFDGAFESLIESSKSLEAS